MSESLYIYQINFVLIKYKKVKKMNKKIEVIWIILLLMINTQPIVCNLARGMEGNENKPQPLSVHDKFSMSPGDYIRFIRFGLRIRSYRIHIPPSYDGKTAVPLVIVLHGNTANSKVIKTKTNFDEVANRDCFIAVYPNGATDLITAFYYLIFHQRWARSLNGGFCCGNAVKRNIDDVGFIKALIEELQCRLNINSSRIYSTGNSNGGIMTYRLGAELSEIFAAIGVSGASIGGRLNKNFPFWMIPEPDHPLPVIIIHGMKDDTVPYDGNVRFLPVNTSVSFWVEHNNCDPIPEINISESGNIIRKTYKNGFEGTEVILYSVVNGTHSWYGSKGSPITEISSTELIWEFFKQYPN